MKIGQCFIEQSFLIDEEDRLENIIRNKSSRIRILPGAAVCEGCSASLRLHSILLTEDK